MWYLILSLIIGIYLFINLVLPGTLGGVIESYVVQPALWIIIAVVTFIIAKHEGLNIWSFKKIRRWQLGGTPFQGALLIGGFHISLLIITGIFVGFGKNPSFITADSFFIYLLYFTSILFGIELSRAYFIKKGTQGKRNATIAIGLVAIFCMLIQIRIIEVAILNPTEPVTIIKFIGEIIPILSMSLFASYLAYLGGALPAIGYMGIVSAFQMYSPLLPNIDWIVKALIGVIVPTVGFLLIQQSLQETHRHGKPKRKILKKRDPTLAWVGVALISLLLVFFSFGYFGVQPTIISTGSMQPALDTGDIAIISEVPIDDIQAGDIIQYERGGYSIIHRVYEVEGPETGNMKVFITKGDANSEPDSDPVTPEQVTGKVIFNIPKLGWIPLFFKSIFDKIGLTI